MRRRLDLAGALVAAPPVLILDEPTTGLDVRARQQMWDVIRDLVSGGATLLLTTQYLEEADRLADDIVVIDHGTAIARGTADDLKSQIGGERIELVLSDATQRDAATRVLGDAAIGEISVDDNGRALSVAVDDGQPALLRVLRGFEEERIEVLDIGLRRPTLDDVFLADRSRRRGGRDRGQERDDDRGGAGMSAVRDNYQDGIRDGARNGDGIVRKGGVLSALLDGWVVAKRNLIKIKRVPDILVFVLISPIMFVLLFSYVFGGAIDVPGDIDYKEFLVPGIFVQTVVFGATFTGYGLADDMQKGIIDRFSPCRCRGRQFWSAAPRPTCSTT